MLDINCYEPESFLIERDYGGRERVKFSGDRINVAEHNATPEQVQQMLALGGETRGIHDRSDGLPDFYTIKVDVMGMEVCLYIQDLEMLWEVAAGTYEPAKEIAA